VKQDDPDDSKPAPAIKSGKVLRVCVHDEPKVVIER
jgi:hypothetical protein